MPPKFTELKYGLNPDLRSPYDGHCSCCQRPPCKDKTLLSTMENIHRTASSPHRISHQTLDPLFRARSCRLVEPVPAYPFLFRPQTTGMPPWDLATALWLSTATEVLVLRKKRNPSKRCIGTMRWVGGGQGEIMKWLQARTHWRALTDLQTAVEGHHAMIAKVLPSGICPDKLSRRFCSRNIKSRESHFGGDFFGTQQQKE